MLVLSLLVTTIFLSFIVGASGISDQTIPKLISNDNPYVKSVKSGDNCILVNPTNGNVQITFNTSCGNSSGGGTPFDNTNVAYLNNTQTFQANNTFNSTTRFNRGIDLSSSSIQGAYDFKLDGASLNGILGSNDILHKATTRYQYEKVGMKYEVRAFGLGLPNYVLSDGTTKQPRINITFDKSGFDSQNVYDTSSFAITFSDAQTLPTVITIFGNKTTDGTKYVIINDTNPQFYTMDTGGGRIWTYDTSIAFGSRLNGVDMMLTFASTPINNGPIFDEFYFLNSVGVSETFSLIQQGGPLNMNFTALNPFGFLINSFVKFFDNKKLYFGNNSEASEYWNRTDFIINSSANIIRQGKVINDHKINQYNGLTYFSTASVPAGNCAAISGSQYIGAGYRPSNGGTNSPIYVNNSGYIDFVRFGYVISNFNESGNLTFAQMNVSIDVSGTEYLINSSIIGGVISVNKSQGVHIPYSNGDRIIPKIITYFKNDTGYVTEVKKNLCYNTIDINWEGTQNG